MRLITLAGQPYFIWAWLTPIYLHSAKPLFNFPFILCVLDALFNIGI